MTENYWQRRLSVHSSRRRVLGGAAGAAAGLSALGLVGCGDDSTSATKPASAPAINATSTPTTVPSAAANTPVRGGTIVVNQNVSVNDVFDPHYSQTTGTLIWSYIGNLLFRPSRDGTKLDPEAVAKWEIPGDGTEYVLTLRPGVKWQNKPPSNGRVLTAEDVAMNLNRIAGRPPYKAGPRAGALAGMDSATAVDPTTVRVKMTSVNSGFLGGVADWHNQIVAKDYVEGGGDFKDVTKIPATGPFSIDKHDDLKEDLFSRHPDYFETGKPYLDGIRRLYIADALSLQAAFVKGDVQLYEEPNKTTLQTISAQTKNFREEAWISGTWYHSRFNLQKKPFDDPRVRQAMMLALDQSKLNDTVMGAGKWEFCAPLASVFPEAYQNADLAKMPGYNPSTKDADIKKAKDLMTAAGLPDGAITFKITVPEQVAAWYELAVRMGDYWKSIWPGIKADIDIAGDFTTFNTRLASGNFDLYSYRFAVAPDAAPDIQTSYHSKGARNYGKYADPAVDALIEKSYAQIKFDDRKATLRLAQDALLAAVPVIPLNIYQYSVLWNTKVQGMEGYGSRLGANSDDTKKFYKLAWLKA